MTDIEHPRLRELFDRALEHPAETRGAYLDQACGRDVELRRRLQAMLAAAEDEHFLSVPAAAGREEPAGLQEGPGTRIGPYRLQGDAAAAAECFGAVRAIRERLAAEDPANERRQTS